MASLKPVKWDQDKVEDIRRLFEQDWKIKDVAGYLGINEGALKRVMHRHGIRSSDLKPSLGDRMPVGLSDLVSRLAFLKGESLVRPEAKARFSDEQLKRWIGKFSKMEGLNFRSFFSIQDIREFISDEVIGVFLFCKEVLGVSLQSYQLKMVSMMLANKRTIYCMGRQSGKDFTISVFVLWLMTTNSNKKILLVSPAQRQSDLLLDRIKAFIAASEELFSCIEQITAEFIRFKNISIVYSLPATTYIRGFTEVSEVFMNEVAHGIDEDTFAAVEPMLSRLNGSLHLFSSPGGCDGKFWECWNSKSYEKLKLPSYENKYLSKDWLELCKQTMSSVTYDNEINGNFSEQLNNFFPEETIRHCVLDYDMLERPNNPDISFYMGIDWGRIRDQTAVVVISCNQFHQARVEYIKIMEKIPFYAQLSEIMRINQIFHCKRLIPEYAGLSLPLCERLRIENLPVVFFKPTLDEKEKAYDYLLVQMEKGLITLPIHDRLLYEMRTFRYELTSQQKKKLHHMTGSSDDVVDALCYAVWGSRITDASFHIAGVRSSAD